MYSFNVNLSIHFRTWNEPEFRWMVQLQPTTDLHLVLICLTYKPVLVYFCTDYIKSNWGILMIWSTVTTFLDRHGPFRRIPWCFRALEFHFQNGFPSKMIYAPIYQIFKITSTRDFLSNIFFTLITSTLELLIYELKWCVSCFYIDLSGLKWSVYLSDNMWIWQLKFAHVFTFLFIVA